MFALGNVKLVIINDKTMPVSSVFMYVFNEKNPSYQAMLPKPATVFPSSRGLSRGCATQLTEPEGAAWLSGQLVGLAIRRSRVRVPLWPLAGFVLGRPEFKFKKDCKGLLKC